MLHDMKVFVEPRVPAITGTAVAFMPYSDEARDIQDWAFEMSKANVIVLAQCQQELAWLRDKKAEFDFIVVDIEHVGGVHAAVELCLNIRNDRPNSKIILLSDDTERDDFGSERIAICDATLKKPVTHRRFTDLLAR